MRMTVQMGSSDPIIQVHDDDPLAVSAFLSEILIYLYWNNNIEYNAFAKKKKNTTILSLIDIAMHHHDF